MKKLTLVQLISLGGLLTAIAVIFQSAPVYLPVMGMAFSPLSTLPIAIAAVMNLFLGIGVLLSSALILLIISPQEAMILFFTTGLLGYAMGALLYRKRMVITILSSTIALSLGILVLTYIAAIPSFEDFAGSFSFPVTLLLFFIFSLLYVSIWFLCLRKFTKLLIRLNFMEKP